LGASGAVKAIACIKSIAHDMIPPTINLHEIDPEFNSQFDFTPDIAREREVLVALNNTFGGHTSTTVFKKYGIS
jgi:3-oxoacyl-[acyl-carrier-protein] synthase II